MKYYLILLTLLLHPSTYGKEVSFQKEILPILQRKCFDCHGPQAFERDGEYEAGLNLSTREGILKGSKKSEVITAGNAKVSSLYTRTSLPEDHRRRMPKKGRALKPADQQLIANWIQEGADFGTWAGVGLKPAQDDTTPGKKGKKRTEPIAKVYIRPEGTSSLVARTALLKSLSQGAPKITDAEITQLREETGAHIARVVEKVDLLTVIYSQGKKSVTRAQIKPLEKIAENVISLKLANTPLNDQIAGTLGKLTRLNELNLQNTRIGTETLRALSKHQALQTLNLIGTKVDSSSIPELNKMKALQRIYLQGTSLKEADFRKVNGKKAPTYRIDFGLNY